MLFNIMDEGAARKYLTQHNNYLKLIAYRKNYDKHPDGENKGKYRNLEFAYLVAFYGFCAERFADKEMKNNFYRLLTCKEIMAIPNMNSNFRRNRMSNARIQQVVTLLYMHKTMVESDGIIRSESEELQKIIKRIERNYGYYSTNPMIKGTFDFLKLVVDNWFKTV